MPSRWEIALVGQATAAIPLTAPLAVLSGWLDDSDPGQRTNYARPAADGRRSGHKDQARAWAFGPIQAEGALDGAGQETLLILMNVRLLDDRLQVRLTSAAVPGREVRLGEQQYFRIAAPPRLVAEASWQELRRWNGTRAWQVRFVTPVCVRRGNRTTPWPAPESIARGLAERWHRLDPATAPPLPGPGAGPVWVSDIDGYNQTQVITRRVQRNGQWQLCDKIASGFTGRLRYVCDHGTDAEAAAFDALIRFAAYAGAGSHTTHGLGVLAPEPTWQPPTLAAAQPTTHASTVQHARRGGL